MNTTDPYFYVRYTRKDSPKVLTIVEMLKSNGINLWTETSLHPGVSWTDVLNNVIENAKGILFFVSNESLSKHWVIGEFYTAIALGKPIVGILLETIDKNKMPFQLLERRIIDLSKSSSITSGIEHLAKYLLRVTENDDLTPIIDRDAIKRLVDLQISVSQGGNISNEVNNEVPDSVFVVHGHDKVFVRTGKVFS